MAERPHLDTAWRRVATALYRRPREGKVFGSVELDITRIESYMQALRDKGIKTTLTHVLFLAIARAIHEDIPELNARVRRGRIVSRTRLEGAISVLLPDSREMSAVKIREPHLLDLATLSSLLAQKIHHTRQGTDGGTRDLKEKLARIPWPFRGWLIGLIGWLTLDLGLYIPALGLRDDRFGCFLLSNIGTLGLDVGYPSLFPNANVSIVVTMGAAKVRPEYIDGQWVPRRVISLGAALDHRLVDGVHGGKLFRYLKKFAADPARMDTMNPNPALGNG
jgi:pyruvate/2-oxoglutarate dehydrogenase complex dihydrolipoamide acyltransferase (E2) component